VRKKERTRRQLAEAAAELFSERGYAGTTIDDIAAAVDVSRAPSSATSRQGGPGCRHRRDQFGPLPRGAPRSATEESLQVALRGSSRPVAGLGVGGHHEGAFLLDPSPRDTCTQGALARGGYGKRDLMAEVIAERTDTDLASCAISS